MESYRTDEEQVEVLKKWWDENGSATMITIAVALASVFGWQTWQQRQSDASNAASMVYQELLESVATEKKLDATQLASVEHVVGQIQTDYKSTTYAQYAGLLLAKTYVDQDKLAEARAALEGVLEQGPKKDLQPLVKLRLAQVVFAQGEAEQALAMVSNVETGAFAASYAELRGDIEQELGDLGAARASYQKAQENSGDDNQLLKLKLANIEMQLAAPATTAAAAKAAATVDLDEKANGESGDAE
ncbi:MAG: YfgM family protein [Pseudomonadales bacterium]